MRRAIDALEEKMEQIVENPELLLDEVFMLGMFSEYQQELPPFKEYIDLTFKRKQMAVISRKSGTKVVHYARIRKTLFSPARTTDKETDSRVKDLAKVAAEAILCELHDKRKVTYKYLSRSGSEYSWNHPDNEHRKQSLLGCKATNDEAESALGGATSQLEKFGRIALNSAAAITDMRKNGFLHRPGRSKNEKRTRGTFHQIDGKLRRAIVMVAMKDAGATRERRCRELEIQAKARRENEELAKKKNMEKATDAYIEASYLIQTYNSDACLKGSPKVVDRLLKRLKSDTAKYNALKTNISIRVKGFDWEWARHAWSKNGINYSVDCLARHLKWIIKEEKRRRLAIPTVPEPKVAKRQDGGVLGTLTDFCIEFGCKVS